MKKIFALLSVIAMLSIAGCAKNFLDTEPTNRAPASTIFEDATKAQTAVDGLYRLFNTDDWGSSWAAENGGLPAYILVMDLKAEDHLMDDMGSGWFYYDFVYDTYGDYSGDRGHQYQIWNFFYTLISGANNIIAKKDVLEGSTDEVNYAIGQAFAIRSFSYMWLVQAYQQNGGAEGSDYRSLPGVPIYTEPTVAGSKGKGRGTVQDVYEQANADIDSAIARLGATAIAQQHPSHIDLAVAYGLKARHALVQQDFETALAAARLALDGREAGSWADVKTVNDASKANVMWALTIQTDQSLDGSSIFNHMDADCESTYSAARHLIVKWLYDQIPDTDSRKAWWTAPLDEDEWGEAGKKGGSNRSWCQKKLVYSNSASGLGDHILMRTEELLLIAAEAACELENFTDAKTFLNEVALKRDPAFSADAFTDSKALNANTYAAPFTLMDEIFLQRRIELWGENPRLFDIQRRGLFFDRTGGGNFQDGQTVEDHTSKPRSNNFILWIPQAEFDGNEAMDENRDQNPEQGEDL